MKELIDATTLGALSVGHYVAMRKPLNSELEAIEQKDSNTLERVCKVMSRVGFVDELRYSFQLDLSDFIQGMHRNALETYLLCTCFDTLAGNDNYHDLQSWLRARRTSILGISECQDFLQRSATKKETLSPTSFSSALSNILNIYNRYYGTNQNVTRLVVTLPDEVKNRLASAYTIYKESASDGEKIWREKSLDDKLKIIFVDYLFQYRRNLYTHESQTFPNFGGISVMREALRVGNVNLPTAETHRFAMDKGFLSVTCHYGDEALFLRESILACLAHTLGLLNTGWNDLYRKAEQQKRMLYALLFELEYNIHVMQLHLQVLSESLLMSAKDEGSPKLKTEIAQSLLDNKSGEGLPIFSGFLVPYIKSATEFNTEIDRTGANTTRHMETTSQDANALMMKSQVRYHGQMLMRVCMQLLEDYPLWTYTPSYYPLRPL